MKEFRFALKYTVPIFFTYLFLGIGFSMLMTNAGYGIFLCTLSPILIYAGSMQYVMVPMMASGASLLEMALMTFFINARHIFYGVGFIDRFRSMGRRYPYMIFSLTDETFSVLCSVPYEEGLDPRKTDFFIALLNHSYWILGCFVGACAGTYLPFNMSGIDFSATAFFLVVVVNQWQEYKSKLPFLTAAACALVFYLLLGPEYFIIPTLASCFVGLMLLRGPIEKEGIRK